MCFIPKIINPSYFQKAFCIKHPAETATKASHEAYNKIPIEILLHIFSFIDPHELRTIYFVCKKWKDLALRPALKNQKIQQLIAESSLNPSFFSDLMIENEHRPLSFFLSQFQELSQLSVREKHPYLGIVCTIDICIQLKIKEFFSYCSYKNSMVCLLHKNRKNIVKTVNAKNFQEWQFHKNKIIQKSYSKRTTIEKLPSSKKEISFLGKLFLRERK